MLIDCSNNKLSHLDVSNNSNLYFLDCSLNLLSNIDLSKNIFLDNLNLNENNISYLDLSNNTMLLSLRCTSNKLKELDLKNNTNLVKLVCENNLLEKLDVCKNTNLVSIECYKNKLRYLDVSNNSNLIVLDCSSNLLSNIDLSKNTLLETLHLLENNISYLDLSNNTILKVLICTRNKLKELDLKNNTNLIKLYCEYNLLEKLDISNSTKLLEIWCEHNQLTELDLSNKYELMILTCFDNPINYLDLRNCDNLETLQCRPMLGVSVDISPKAKLRINHYNPEEFVKINALYKHNLKVYSTKFTDIKTLESYKKPSERVESDDPRIISLAKEITKGITSDYDKAKALYIWVCTNIEWNYVGSWSAVTTLENMSSAKGDYSYITAALLRAAGIPAKIVKGYTSYYPGSSNEELYDLTNIANHIWVEAYVDNRWIILDTMLRSYVYYSDFFDMSLLNMSEKYRYIEYTEPINTYKVNATKSAVFINGIKVTFEAYNIGGNNYFKLRDLAYTLIIQKSSLM